MNRLSLFALSSVACSSLAKFNTDEIDTGANEDNQIAELFDVATPTPGIDDTSDDSIGLDVFCSETQQNAASVLSNLALSPQGLIGMDSDLCNETTNSLYCFTSAAEPHNTALSDAAHELDLENNRVNLVIMNASGHGEDIVSASVFIGDTERVFAATRIDPNRASSRAFRVDNDAIVRPITGGVVLSNRSDVEMGVWLNGSETSLELTELDQSLRTFDDSIHESEQTVRDFLSSGLSIDYNEQGYPFARINMHGRCLSPYFFD